MRKSFRKRIVSLISCMAMTCTFLPQNTAYSAGQTEWKFDLGANAENGYTSVSATQGYDKSKGYGFRNTAGVKNVNASGKGALSDAVQFTDGSDGNTFDVDLPVGLYRVNVTLGDTNRTSVYMENMLQIVNMTGNNAKDSILVPVTDGQLNIRAAAGKAGYAFSISTVEITKVSDDATLPPTIWFCGDSTVCNYYPLDTSVQAGWGQVFNKYIDTSVWQVRDMASSGQFAKGFVESGQFATIENYGKQGDVYIISIGINDTNPNYTNVDEYYENVTYMVKKAKEKGMRVILVKQQGRANDVTDNPKLKGRWFGTTLDKIGEEQNVQVLDLFNLFFDYAKSIGQEATTALYMNGDTLHPNRQGAMKLAELAAANIDLSAGTGAEIPENTPYIIRNVNSGLCMAVEGEGKAGANVSQQNPPETDNSCLWTVKSAGNGWYYICSQLDKGEYFLDLANGKQDNGTNIGIWTDTNSDAQLFRFEDKGNGRYNITSKSTNGKKCIEVKNALKDSGANVQQWENNGHDCQAWTLEPVVLASQEDATIGDINNDGVVDSFDLVLSRKQAVESYMNHSEKIRADINADGKTTIADSVMIQKYLLNQESFDSRQKLYYASDMTYSQGMTENVNAGFTDEKYLNLDNKTGSFMEWTVNVSETGNYLCDLFVANGSTENRPMKIEVNGAKDYWVQDFLSTSAWTTWNHRGIVLPLNKGKNVIRMTSMANGGAPNIDTIHIELTEEPIAEIYIPKEEPKPDNNDKPTIFIAGDSTVQTYRASYAPQQGWGAYLGELVGNNYTVANHAIAGRSSKSFYDNGRLDTILNDMKKGDYLLVQFGINDSAYNNAERYAPVSDKVPGTDGSFEYYISKYIEGTLEKGGTPVLVTTVLGLKAYNSSTKKFDNSYQNYCDAMKKLANYYKIPCIDLNTLMRDHYNSIGYDKAYTYHLISTELSTTDMTHFTETGAKAVAQLVADELKKQGVIK